MAAPAVVVRIVGEVQDLRSKFGQVANDLEGLGNRTANVFRRTFLNVTSVITSRFGEAGKEAQKSLEGIASSVPVVGAAVAGLGAAFVGLAESGLKNLIALNNEVRAFQRVAGGSAEDASKMIAAFNLLGVDSEAGAAGIFKLSRAVNEHSDKLRADGIEVARAKNGQADLYGTLQNVSDAYRAAGAGAAGDKIVFDAFGRSGAALIPILAAGGDKLKEFADEAAKNHEIISDSESRKIKDLQINLAELRQQYEGLKREAGQKVIPAASFFVEAGRGFLIMGDALASGVGKGFSAVNNLFDHTSTRQKEAAAAAEEQASAEDAATAAVQRHKDAEDAAAEATKAYKAILDEYNTDLQGTLGAQLGLVGAQSAVSDAEQQLADDFKNISDAASGTTGKIETFQDALAKTFDSLVDVDEAQIRINDSARSVGDALKGVGSGAETAAAYMDRYYKGLSGPQDDHGDKVRSAVDSAVRAGEQLADAMARSGEIPDTAQARKGVIEDQLNKLKQQYPQVAQQVDNYLDRLRKVPNLTTDAAAANDKLAKSKRDLKKDTADLVAAVQSESDFEGTATDKHQHLIDKLEEEKKKYPELAGAIQKFVDDANAAWLKYVGTLGFSPEETAGLAGVTPEKLKQSGDPFKQYGKYATPSSSVTNVVMNVTAAPGENAATTATIVAQKLGWNIAKITGRI